MHQLPRRARRPAIGARAESGDRIYSFGEVAAVSDAVDDSLARLLCEEASHLVIVPGFEPSALELLRSKRDGADIVLALDPDHDPRDR